MCGIVTYFSNQKTCPVKVEDAFRDMLWVDSIRGYHSTGLIYEAEGQVDYVKKAITGWDFIQLAHPSAILKNLGKTPYVIGHNRAATRGAVNHSNAHPFEFDHIVGVHNGTLSNHYNLITNKEGTFPVDSMYLYKALSLRPSEEVIPQVRGSFNLIWHDSRDNTIHLLRNDDRSYSFLKIEKSDIMLGASEKEMAKWLIKRRGLNIEYAWDPKPFTEYVFDPEHDMIKPIHKIKHKKWVEPPKKERTVVHLPDRRDKRARGGPGVSSNGIASTSKTIRVCGDEQNIEFFFDHFECNNPPTKGGRVTVNVFGETTVADEEVVAFGMFKEDFELNEWYIGTAWWIDAGNGEAYWTLKPDTIRPHPGNDPSEVFFDCSMCNKPETEDDMIFISSNPYCIDCCQQLNVTTEQMDDPNDAVKLFIH